MSRVNGTHERLRAAVEGVFLAHGEDYREHVVLGEWPVSLWRSKVVADFHVRHDGDWTAGSCDGELFLLEWEIHRAENPPPRPALWRRLLYAVLTRLDPVKEEGRHDPRTR